MLEEVAEQLQEIRYSKDTVIYQQEITKLRGVDIIAEGEYEFNGNGYHNTSLVDIASRLEVSKPTVYYYVTSKEQLLFQCFVAGVERIRAAFRDVRRLEVPGRERLNGRVLAGIRRAARQSERRARACPARRGALRGVRRPRRDS